MTRVALLYAASLAYAASLLQGASAWAIQKRANAGVPPLETLDMPLHFDSNGRYVIPVTMGSGSKPQQFNFTLSTGTGLTYVASSACSDCSNIASYSQASSSSAVSLSGSDNTTYFGQSLAGSLIKENCGAKLSNGSFWAYPNQTVVLVDQQSSDPVLSNGISGIFGLGTNRPLSGQSNSSLGLADSIYGQWLPRNPTHSNFTFGMALEPPPSSPTAGQSAGLLHWLVPDPAFYKPDQVSWVTADGAISDTTTSNGSNTTPAQDWMVTLGGWVATVGNTHLSNTQSVSAVVDPMFPNIYMPADQAKLIHDAINGSSPAPSNLSTLGAASQAFIIPCDTQYTFGLVAGSQTFVVNPDDLIIQQNDGTCLSGIEAFTDTTQTGYLVGARFIGTVYLIFNIPGDGPSTLGLSPRVTPSNGSSHVGAIVGGTVGGVAGVIALGLLAFWHLRRRADRRLGPFEIEDTDKPMQHVGVEPFLLDAPTPAQLSRPSPPASPMPSQPLLFGNESSSALPPPSYEEASSSSGTPVAARPPRDFKGRYSRAVSAQSESTAAHA